MQESKPIEAFFNSADYGDNGQRAIHQGSPNKADVWIPFKQYVDDLVIAVAFQVGVYRQHQCGIPVNGTDRFEIRP